MPISETLHFAEHTLQELALGLMALVYIIRLIWLFRFKRGKDGQPQTGAAIKTPPKGAAYSLSIVAMPWAMESSRTRPFFYTQFVIFHLGVVAAISLSFLIPYAPGFAGSAAVVTIMQVLTGAAFIVACLRIFRRVTNKHMRAISTPDDFFSISLLTVWFLFAFLAAPNTPELGEGALMTFFMLTAFFLIYVPFSKISHYLYYPFTRYWLGRTLGHRGVYPITRKPHTGAGQH